MGLLIAAVAGAFLAGAVVYLAIKLTISVLKSYKKKKSSKLMAAQVKDLVKSAPSMSLNDLDDDDIVLAEYDIENDDMVQDIAIAKDVDSKVTNIVEKNGGIVVFD